MFLYVNDHDICSPDVVKILTLTVPVDDISCEAELGP